MKRRILFISLFFLFTAFTCFAKNIYLSPITLKVVDAQTNDPIKGLKVSSILTLYKATFFHGDTEHIFLDEYETDENGIVEIKEAKLHIKTRQDINSLELVINAACTEEISDDNERKASHLAYIFLDEPDVTEYTYTPDKRYKNAIIRFEPSTSDKKRRKKLQISTGIFYIRFLF